MPNRRKTDKRAPTLLQRARTAENLAKVAMQSAKEAYKQAHAAYDAIGEIANAIEPGTPSDDGEALNQ